MTGLIRKESLERWDKEPLPSVILQCLGGASVAWMPKPEGMFLSQVCVELKEYLLQRILREMAESQAVLRALIKKLATNENDFYSVDGDDADTVLRYFETSTGDSILLTEQEWDILHKIQEEQ